MKSFTSLTPAERRAHLNQLQVEHSALHKKEKEIAFKNRPECPYCNQAHVHSVGFRNGIMHYRCTKCNKSYSARTGTKLHWLHKAEAFEPFSEFVVNNGYTKLKVLCEMFDITISTASIWRRRVFESNNISIKEQKRIHQEKLSLSDNKQNN